MLNVKRLDVRRKDHWQQMTVVVAKAAPPTVTITDAVLDRVRSALLSGEMSGWMFVNGSPMGIALTMIREDKLLGKRELIIYAAAALRNMSVEDWDQCFAKMRLHSIKEGCTHMSCYTIVPRIMKMAQRMGGDVDTRYVSIPLGG